MNLYAIFSAENARDITVGLISTAVAGLTAVLARDLAPRFARRLRRPTIVFVSTGGTCRDPMAKAILQELAHARRAKINIYAAGIAHGLSKTASKAARRIVKEELGKDLLRWHQSRALNARLVSKADLILTMESHYAREVKKLFPDSAGKVHTIAAFLGVGEEIANPYRKPNEIDPAALERYQTSFRQLRRALEGGAERIFRALGVG